MRDYVEIGATPCDEDCAQVGSANYSERAIAECRRFIAEIRRVCGPEPSGAHLKVRANSHDFGTYYEVAVVFDDKDAEAVNYAYWVERNAPTTWLPGINSAKWPGYNPD